MGHTTHPEEPAGGRAITAQLAAWCTEVSWRQIPDDVADQTRFLMLDGVGCALFGATTQWGRLVADFVHDSSTGDGASVWGVPGPRAGAPMAALANGTLVHSFEFDDLHPKGVVHGIAQVLPAVLAVAELRTQDPASAPVPATHPSADELLTAVVVGLEASARIGLVTGSRSLRRGFHPSPNTGAFGAAAAAGRLLQLDAEQMADALGIAASGGGALMAAQYGAMVKRMHAGLAAQSGVQAALLAARGLTGTADVLETPYGGFVHVHAGEEAVGEVDAITEELGERWETLQYGVKPHPCCGSNHTAVDAYLAILGERPGLDVRDIERIEVDCSTLTRDHVGWPWRPGGVTAAQMNLPYTLAVLATDRALGVDQFDPARTQDSALADVARRVVVRASPDIDAQGSPARHTVRLTVTTTTRQQFSREVAHPRGRPPSRLSGDEVVKKYRDLAGRVLDPSGVATAEALILRLATDEPQARAPADVLTTALVPDRATTPEPPETPSCVAASQSTTR